MATDNLIKALSRNPIVISAGLNNNIRRPRPAGRDQQIVEMVHEIGQRMGIEMPPVLFHEGNAANNGYVYDQNCLILSEHLADVLQGDELKTVIAHELNHKKHAPIYERIARAKIHLWAIGLLPEDDTQPDSGTITQIVFGIRYDSAVERLVARMEVNSDEAAAEMFGVENAINAVMKLTPLMDLPAIKMAIMADQEILSWLEMRKYKEAHQNDIITQEDIAHKLERMLTGSEEVKCGAAGVNARIANFRRIRKDIEKQGYWERSEPIPEQVIRAAERRAQMRHGRE